MPEFPRVFRGGGWGGGAWCSHVRGGESGTVLVTWLPPTRPERAAFRLRKWVILRLVSIVDTLHAEKEDDVIEEVARWDRLCSQLPIGTEELGLLPSPGLVSL